MRSIQSAYSFNHPQPIRKLAEARFNGLNSPSDTITFGKRSLYNRYEDALSSNKAVVIGGFMAILSLCGAVTKVFHDRLKQSHRPAIDQPYINLPSEKKIFNGGA